MLVSLIIYYVGLILAKCHKHIYALTRSDFQGIYPIDRLTHSQTPHKRKSALPIRGPEAHRVLEEETVYGDTRYSGSSKRVVYTDVFWGKLKKTYKVSTVVQGRNPGLKNSRKQERGKLCRQNQECVERKTRVNQGGFEDRQSWEGQNRSCMDCLVMENKAK